MFVHNVLRKEEDVDCTPERFESEFAPDDLCLEESTVLESGRFHIFSRARVVVPFPETHIDPVKVEVGRLLFSFWGPGQRSRVRRVRSLRIDSHWELG